MVQTIQIDARPHPGQLEVHEHPARFKIVAGGRRWGKTRLGVNECLDAAAKGGRAWWIAPTYKMSEVGWRPLRQMGAKIPGAEIRKVDRQVLLPGGGEVTVRSADKPDSLRGEGLNYVVIDECAFVSETAWTEALRPALSDRLGKAIFISTPKGRNWFWRAYQTGEDPENDEWQSWRFPTESNPYIDAAEIEAARRMLPERVFQQEYLAIFIDDAGGVFRRVMDAATATAQDTARAGHDYVFGVDWGQQNDFTAIAVIDVHEQALVYLDRFRQIDYVVQSQRLQALAGRFKPTAIIAESNSMGLPVIERLTRDGLYVQPFQTTNATKMAVIDALALAFERSDIRILNDPVLVGELQAYEMSKTPSGLRKFSAPEGMHDDTVIALALAWQAASRPPAAGETVDVDMGAYKPQRRKSIWD